jgi:hypothetical protein
MQNAFFSKALVPTAAALSSTKAAARYAESAVTASARNGETTLMRRAVIRSAILLGRAIHSLDDLYDQISTRLSLPAHFGRNLDALWDVLSTDVEGPF